MKALLAYIRDMISMIFILAWMVFFAVFGLIAAIAYNFYPTTTLIIVALTLPGLIVEFLKDLRSKNN
ncbi:hypothetical protein CRG49_001365 [Neisseria sp. N95_16]|uniref:Uncharacterized protein n=1 Tax=Neisseria brasiliensis TaxID=2666100 RepID=A0A7X2H024_9NEIS|nr:MULTISPECIES: hypothetical protein [Neisseria]MRN38999.1 hypothetical protein [Neisseria brasiliensis]PJO10637.1 hypothetical protein CRG49_001365 [Neisseria sp. N95_16]